MFGLQPPRDISRPEELSQDTPARKEKPDHLSVWRTHVRFCQVQTWSPRAPLATPQGRR